MEIFEELLRNEISSYNFVAQKAGDRVNPKIDVLFAHPNKKDPATNFKFAKLNPTLRSYLRFNKHMAKLIGFYPQTNAGHRHCAQYQFLGISVRFIGEFLKFLRILISALADLST